MAAPAIPSNFVIQQGNGQILLTWDLVAGATSGYIIYRSTDNITFSSYDTSTVNSFLDTVVTVGTQYWYKVSSTNGTESPTTSALSAVPTLTGDMTLGQLRLLAQQKADRVNSNFITVPEWNTYINQSYFELYDILVQAFGNEYYVHTPYQFTTDGSQFYDLPDDFYKALGVDCGLDPSSNAWVTLKRFNFVNRNLYVFPNITTSFLGVWNLGYRIVGNRLMFIPPPASGQILRLWYIPKMTQLLQDTDIAVGISGWTEYIAVDAAIKALAKEESPTDFLMAAKAALIDRIQAAAENRDAGEPDTISNSRRFNDYIGWGPNGNGPSGGR